MATSAAAVSDLAEVGRHRWEALDAPASFYLSYDWMAAMSSTVSDRARVAVAADASGRPLAGFPVHRQDEGSYPPYDPWAVAFGDRRPDAVAGLRPVLTSVAPGFVGGVRWAAGLDRAPAAAALHGAVAAVEAEGVPATAFLYVPEGEDPVLEEVLADRGYAAAVVEADCRLDVRWTSFEEYVASRDRHRRKSVKAEVKAFARAGFHVEVADGQALTDDLAPLHAQWRGKYGRTVAVDALRRQYAAVRERVAPAMRMFLARLDGDVVAFAQFYLHDGVMYSRAVGFDYDRIGRAFAYFNVVVYEPLRWAIANGVREIRFSMESYDAKVGRGCRLAPLRLHARAPDRPGLAAALAEVDSVNRHRFREVEAAHRSQGAADR